MISYEPFWALLKELKISQYFLIHHHNISPSQLNRLKQNQPVSTETISMLCRILNCDVSDIMRFVAVKDRH